MSTNKNDAVPRTVSTLKFAIGSWVGFSSNSWRVFNNGNDIYVCCRDNYREVKWSLHESGRWRMGFTSEGFVETAALHRLDQDRAWMKWSPPAEFAPGVVHALSLDFFTQELAVTGEFRPDSFWKRVTMTEAAPDGHYVRARILIADREAMTFHHEAGLPSFLLGSFPLANGKWVYLQLSQEVLTDRRRMELGLGYLRATVGAPEGLNDTVRILVNGVDDEGVGFMTELNRGRPDPETLLLMPTSNVFSNPGGDAR